MVIESYYNLQMNCGPDTMTTGPSFNLRDDSPLSYSKNMGKT